MLIFHPKNKKKEFKRKKWLALKSQGVMPLKMFLQQTCVSILACECNKNIYQRLIIILPVISFSSYFSSFYKLSVMTMYYFYT